MTAPLRNPSDDADSGRSVQPGPLSHLCSQRGTQSTVWNRQTGFASDGQRARLEGGGGVGGAVSEILDIDRRVRGGEDETRMATPNQRAVVEEGEKIYDRPRAALEGRSRGQFAAIDISSQ